MIPHLSSPSLPLAERAGERWTFSTFSFQLFMDTTPTLPGMDELVKTFKFASQPYEYKIVPLRECPTPETMQLSDTPDKAAEYWRLHVPKHPYFNPECECFTVLLVNTRRRVKAHQIVSFGTHDTILVHPLTVFRLAVITCAAAVVLMQILCVAAHKLCYVTSRVMCSGRFTALTSAGVPQRKECCGCAC